jgi:hypothetical protein
LGLACLLACLLGFVLLRAWGLLGSIIKRQAPAQHAGAWVCLVLVLLRFLVRI